MYQSEEIIDLADELGIDYEQSSSSADMLRSIAYQVGIDDFNSITDLDKLEKKLKDMKKEKNDSQSSTPSNNRQANNNRRKPSNPKRNNGSPKKPSFLGKKSKTPKAKHGSLASGKSSGTGSNAGGSNAFDKLLDDKKRKIIITKVLSIVLAILPYVLIGVIILAVFAALFTLLFGDEENGGNGSNGNASVIGNYYKSDCENLTVYFVDEENDIDDIQTLSMEDYITNTVYDEVGELNDPELYKAYAIIVRNSINNSVKDCTVKSTNKNHKNIINSSDSIAVSVRESLEDVKGKVMAEGSKLVKPKYDYFCAIATDNNYYTLNVNNQKLPKSWVDSQSTLTAEDKAATCTNNTEFSIMGAHYLSQEYDYDYTKILQFYFGSGFSMASNMYNSIAGLEIKNTKKAQPITKNIDEFLQERGSSVEEMNYFIYSNVLEAGPGTREAVIVSALSIVNYLYDNFDAKIPYCNYLNNNYWINFGVSPYFGNSLSPHNGGGYCPFNVKGIDCTAFVSMVLKNAGVDNRKLPSGRTSLYTSDWSKYTDKCDTLEEDCVGKPGDILLSPAHGALIVDVDEEAGVYFVAESGNGGDGVIVQTWKIHKRFYSYPTTPIYVLNMDHYYGKEEYTIADYETVANPLK